MARWPKGQSGNSAGRKKGAKNKTTVAKEYAHDEAGKRRMLPLAYMLRIMRDPKKPLEVRMEMAKAAAPYMHSRLQSTTVSNPEGEELSDPRRQMSGFTVCPKPIEQLRIAMV